MKPKKRKQNSTTKTRVKNDEFKYSDKAVEYELYAVMADIQLMGTPLGKRSLENIIETLETLRKQKVKDYKIKTEILNFLGQIYNQQDEYDKIDVIVKEYIEMDLTPKDFSDLIEKVTERFEEKGEFEIAIKYYQKALEKFETAQLLSGIGYCYGKLENHNESLKYLNRAIELEPENPLLYNDRGYTFFLMGDLKKAKIDYEKALRIESDYSLAKNNLNELIQIMNLD